MRLFVLICTLAACGFTPSAASQHMDAAPGSEPGPIVDAQKLDAPDAMPTWRVIDTLTVTCASATPVTSSVTLTSTGMYHLRASTECIVNDVSTNHADADYFAYDFGPPTDSQSGVDNGIAIDDTNPGASKTRWGNYDASHVYEIPFTGKNAPITAEYWDSNYSNNSGGLKLEILEYK